tara:strand:- start:8322 stop:8855 length:534 start_codon:yes stop_codon:yes gene_type:complete
MAITLISNYAKRLGLPGYSSHQFSVSVQTELTDLERVPGEIARLYHLLQTAVDREIQQTGFVPDEVYGLEASTPSAGNGNPNGNPRHHNNRNQNSSSTWQCTPKQRQLIRQLAGELQLSAEQVDQRSQQLFRLPAAKLNKLSASGLISDLLEQTGKDAVKVGSRGSNGSHRQPTGEP